MANGNLALPYGRMTPGGGISWLTGDPVAEAQVLRSQRQGEALAQLGGAVKRGATNYMKGGLRGMIDPQYAEEQSKAATEDAELSARLGEQTDKAEEESKQPSEKADGHAAAEPTTSLGEVAKATSGIGGVLKKVYQGPGTRIDLTELAKKRGRLQAVEDRIRALQAVAPAFKNVEDPGAEISKFMSGTGFGGLGGMKQKPNLTVEQKNDPAFMQEYERAGGDLSKVDYGQVERNRLRIKTNEAAMTRAPERPSEFQEKMAEVNRLEQQRFGGKATPAQHKDTMDEVFGAGRAPAKEARPTKMDEQEAAAIQAIRERKRDPTYMPARHEIDREIGRQEQMRNPMRGKGRGSTAPAEVEKRARAMARLVGEDESNWEAFVGVSTVDEALKRKDALTEQRKNQPPPEVPTGPTGATQKGNALNKSDQQPAQPDPRLGETGRNPADPKSRRLEHTPAPPPPPKGKPPVSPWGPD
jgi:hypothetical protein